MKLWSMSGKTDGRETPARTGARKRVSSAGAARDYGALFKEWWFVGAMVLYGLISVLFLSQCSYPVTPSVAAEPTAAAAAEEETEELQTEPVYTQATLAYAGDLVCHTGLNDEAFNGTDYDYVPILEGAVPYVSDADLAFCCLETTFPDTTEYHGYPMFKSPKALATSLKTAGFDLINTASNHCMDGLKDGLDQTLDVLDAAGLDHVGTYRTQAEWDENHGVLVEDVNGISIAFLSYTYGTNGIPVTGFDYATNIFFKDYLDAYATDITELDLDKIDADMQYARALDTDLIVVLIHWGLEYFTEPVDYQREVADHLFEQGADLVCGGHPHVPEPMEVRRVVDLDGNERTGYLCYCMGNFISAMNDHYTNLTAVTTLELEKNLTTGETYLKNVSYAPLMMVDTADHGVTGTSWRYKLVDLHRAIDSYEAGDNLGYINATLYQNMLTALDDLHDIFGARFDRFDASYQPNASGELPVPEESA